MEEYSKKSDDVNSSKNTSHNSQEKEDITLKMSKHTIWQVVAGIFALLFVISLFTGGFGLGGDTPTGAVVDQPVVDRPANNPPEERVKVSLDDDPVLGDKKAPVTIIEFSDFQCPFCSRFHQQTLSQIKTRYIDTGKVKFVYRDFPLNFHENAQKAAEAAQCANEQGKFWEMHDKIFENQASLSPTIYSTWATDLGLDITKFNTCLDSGKYTAEVQKDFADGGAIGVTGTPSFYIGNEKDGYTQIGGAQPFSVFQQVIDQELARV